MCAAHFTEDYFLNLGVACQLCTKAVFIKCGNSNFARTVWRFWITACKYVFLFKWKVLHNIHISRCQYEVHIIVVSVSKTNKTVNFPLKKKVLHLKVSYDVAKNNIIWCIWCDAMCLCGLRFKKHFSTYCTLLLLLYAPPFWNTEKSIVLRSEVCSDWPAIQCIVIGRLPQAWDGNVTPLTVLWHKNKKNH